MRNLRLVSSVLFGANLASAMMWAAAGKAWPAIMTALTAGIWLSISVEGE